jgi:hypothetical protein
MAGAWRRHDETNIAFARPIATRSAPHILGGLDPRSSIGRMPRCPGLEGYSISSMR